MPILLPTSARKLGRTVANFLAAGCRRPDPCRQPLIPCADPATRGGVCPCGLPRCIYFAFREIDVSPSGHVYENGLIGGGNDFDYTAAGDPNISGCAKYAGRGFFGEHRWVYQSVGGNPVTASAVSGTIAGSTITTPVALTTADLYVEIAIYPSTSSSPFGAPPLLVVTADFGGANYNTLFKSINSFTYPSICKTNLVTYTNNANWYAITSGATSGVSPLPPTYAVGAGDEVHIEALGLPFPAYGRIWNAIVGGGVVDLEACGCTCCPEDCSLCCTHIALNMQDSNNHPPIFRYSDGSGETNAPGDLHFDSGGTCNFDFEGIGDPGRIESNTFHYPGSVFSLQCVNGGYVLTWDAGGIARTGQMKWRITTNSLGCPGGPASLHPYFNNTGLAPVFLHASIISGCPA